MDKRVEKTKSALYTAFMQLREKKKLRDIKIMDLCTAAGINKTTFYAHYKDIYELSDSVEKQLLYKIILSIPKNIEYSMDNPDIYTKEVTLAFKRYDKEMNILFRDSEMSHLGIYLEQVMKKVIFDKNPYLENSPELNIILSYCISGAFYSQMNNPALPFETILSTIEKITQTLQPLLTESRQSASAGHTES